MQNQIDISTLSIEELKALAYDFKTSIEATQQNLNLVEQEIFRKTNDAQHAAANQAREEALVNQNPKGEGSPKQTAPGEQPNAEQPEQPGGDSTEDNK